MGTTAFFQSDVMCQLLMSKNWEKMQVSMKVCRYFAILMVIQNGSTHADSKTGCVLKVYKKLLCEPCQEFKSSSPEYQIRKQIR